MTHPLRPRPQPSAAELAAIAAAATELLERRRREPERPDAVPRWRFSGRWFAAHPYSEARRPAL